MFLLCVKLNCASQCWSKVEIRWTFVKQAWISMKSSSFIIPQNLPPCDFCIIFCVFCFFLNLCTVVVIQCLKCFWFYDLKSEIHLTFFINNLEDIKYVFKFIYLAFEAAFVWNHTVLINYIDFAIVKRRWPPAQTQRQQMNSMGKLRSPQRLWSNRSKQRYD